MRQRRDVDGDHFDLLPFIAILMCTLGCLLLVTMSMAALAIGPAAGEGWIPTRDASRPTKIPILVEWDGQVAVVHWEGRRVSLKPVSNDKDDRDDWQKMLEELKSRKDTHYALFAVRPSGFANFNELANRFRARKIVVGYEPIAKDRPVRLLSRTAP